MLNLLVLRSPNLAQQAEFYTLLLDCTFDYHQHGKGAWHYATEINGLVLELYPLKEGVADNSTRLGFKITCLTAKIQMLQEKGYKIINQPQETKWGYVALITDVDGRKIELTQETS